MSERVSDRANKVTDNNPYRRDYCYGAFDRASAMFVYHAIDHFHTHIRSYIQLYEKDM